MARMAYAAIFIVMAGLIAMLLYWQVEIIHLGGPVMIPLVMCSVFSVALTIERLYYFFTLHLGVDMERFFNGLHQALETHRWQEAQQLCEQTKGPVARVALAGLASRTGTPQEIDEVMEGAAHSELPAVEQHLRWLSTLAQVSTLLGLLGTVTGLVRAFQVIQNKATAGNPVNPSELAGGVWEALITTVAGLSIAIPTIIAYNYLAGRVGEVQFHMEKAAGFIAGWRRLGGGKHAAD